MVSFCVTIELQIFSCNCSFQAKAKEKEEQEGSVALSVEYEPRVSDTGSACLPHTPRNFDRFPSTYRILLNICNVMPDDIHEDYAHSTVNMCAALTLESFRFYGFAMNHIAAAVIAALRIQLVQCHIIRNQVPTIHHAKIHETILFGSRSIRYHLSLRQSACFRYVHQELRELIII